MKRANVPELPLFIQFNFNQRRIIAFVFRVRCSKKMGQTPEEDFMQVAQQEFPDSDFDEEEDFLYHVKLNAQLRKEHKKMLDAARATWKKPNCQTNIVATDNDPRRPAEENKREEAEEE
ncbi:hypothetical protein P8452_45478 [Trifolium repens]|nr:hypothetical protein P8452_45478 [Trifolium repens]